MLDISKPDTLKALEVLMKNARSAERLLRDVSNRFQDHPAIQLTILKEIDELLAAQAHFAEEMKDMDWYNSVDINVSSVDVCMVPCEDGEGFQMAPEFDDTRTKTIKIFGEKTAGNAYRHYRIGGYERHDTTGLSNFTDVVFMDGVDEKGVPNGTTIETLLTIVAHRLIGFQGGSFPAPENARAMYHISNAMTALNERTQRVTKDPSSV